MKYSVDICNDIHSLAYCLKKINDKIEEVEDWKISIHIDYPTDYAFLNFDVDNKILQISNNKEYNTLQDLDTVIERIKKVNSGYIF